MRVVLVQLAAYRGAVFRVICNFCKVVYDVSGCQTEWVYVSEVRPFLGRLITRSVLA